MTEAAPSQLSIGRKADRYRLMPTLVKTDAELNYYYISSGCKDEGCITRLFLITDLRDNNQVSTEL